MPGLDPGICLILHQTRGPSPRVTNLLLLQLRRDLRDMLALEARHAELLLARFAELTALVSNYNAAVDDALGIDDDHDDLPF